MGFGRGCPATRRMCHQFDPATHRCKCGRWRAGFAPKTEPVRPRHECQICEAKFATVTGGALGHHGYKRPGWGFIVGDCIGVGHQPFPAYDALEKYAMRLAAHIVGVEEQRESYRTETRGLPDSYIRYEGFGYRERTKIPFTIRAGAAASYRTPGHQSFEDRRKVLIAACDNEIKAARADAVRVAARIKRARSMS